MKPFRSLKFWIATLLALVLAVVGGALSKLCFDAIEKSLAADGIANLPSAFALVLISVLSFPVLIQFVITLPTYFLVARGKKNPKERLAAYREVLIFAAFITALVFFSLVVLTAITISYQLVAVMYLYSMLISTLLAIPIIFAVYFVIYLILNKKTKKV